MAPTQGEPITLDHRRALSGLRGVPGNLSGVAVADRCQWNASDEGRTVECLEPEGDGYRLRNQHSRRRSVFSPA